MLTIDQQACRWVIRMTDQGLDEAERAALEAWCAEDARHRGALVRAQALLRAQELAMAQSATLPGRARPAAVVAVPVESPRVRRRAVLGYGALAAGVALMIGIASLPMRAGGAHFETAVGEFRNVPLADQSTVQINSGSRIEVGFSEHAREVRLARGEVWFQVAKDKSRPFTVDAGQGRLRAVGTSFSVRREGAAAEVLVTEGVVEVWRDGESAHKIVLTAGEGAKLAAGGAWARVATDPDEIARRLAWREGRLVFNNQTLAEAVTDFNRYTRRQIVIADPALRGKTLVGRYRADDPETFARDVGQFLQVPVAVTHDRIIIGDARLLDRAPRSRTSPT